MDLTKSVFFRFLLGSTQPRIEPIPRKASNPMGYLRDPMSNDREPRRSVDTDMSRSVTRELTPDSPVSQVRTLFCDSNLC